MLKLKNTTGWRSDENKNVKNSCVTEWMWKWCRVVTLHNSDGWDIDWWGARYVTTVAPTTRNPLHEPGANKEIPLNYQFYNSQAAPAPAAAQKTQGNWQLSVSCLLQLIPVPVQVKPQILSNMLCGLLNWFNDRIAVRAAKPPARGSSKQCTVGWDCPGPGSIMTVSGFPFTAVHCGTTNYRPGELQT